MYRFVDITKQQSVVDLPSEAMQVNGVYLENEISGYRTLYTEGRETLETEISTIDNDYIDGAIEDSARDLSRAVRVHFLLVSHSPAEFREKFHRLNRLLRTRDSVFIFRDEPDKYLKGTKTDITDVEPGRLATEGCINIVCNDPYKYAIDEKVVKLTPSGASEDVEIYYEGSKEVYPVFTARMAGGPNSFLAFSNQTGAIIRFGDADSQGQDDTDEILVYDNGYADLAMWEFNTAHVPSYGGLTRVQNGVPALPVNSITPKTYGTGPNAWHGMALSKEVSQSSAFRFTWRCEFWQEDGSATQSELVCSVSDGDGTEIAGVRYVYDKTRAATKVSVELYAGGALRKTIQAASFSTNGLSGKGCGESSISKSGSYILFDIAGQKHSFVVDELEATQSAGVNFYFGAYGSSAGMQVSQLYASSFTIYLEGKAVVASDLKKGDVVTINCRDATPYLNGAVQYGLGRIDNEWQGMRIVPGRNVITCQSSAWSKGVEYEIRYREAWL